MARNLFGGSSDDYAVDTNGRPLPNRRIRFYTSAAMTTEITDLASDISGTGTPLTVSTDGHGFWGPAYGPDGVTTMYAGAADGAGNPPAYVVAIYTHSAAGVSSFNTRTGPVTLAKADITGTGLAAADVAADASGAAATVQTNLTAEVTRATAAEAALGGGMQFRTAVVVATTNQAISGLPTVDSVTLTSGQVILLTGQTTGSQNGLWAVAAGAWARPSNFAAGLNATGTSVLVESGTAGAGTTYAVTGTTNNVVGTNVLTFVKTSGTTASGVSGGSAWLTGTSYTAGAVVVQAGVNYESTVAHTSGVFATDLAAGKWIETGINSTAAVALSNTAPPRPGTAAAGTATTARRSDAVQGSFGLYMFYGDGHHGAVTFDGSTTVTGFTRSGSVYTSSQPTFYTNVTVNVGVTVICQGPMHVSGTLTNNGTIHMNGNDGAAGTGGAQVQVNQFFDRGGIAGNGALTAGGAGSYRNTSTGGGGAGGVGGSGAAGANAGGTVSFSNMVIGTGTIAQQPVGSALFAFWGLLMLGGAPMGVSGGGGGGGGGGDGTNSGGGAGSGGGVCVVNALILAGNGAFQANGGKGANGVAGNAGGGGGGGGGICQVNTTDATGWTGTVTATGGTFGTGVGTGANGVAGAAGYASLKTWA